VWNRIHFFFELRQTDTFPLGLSPPSLTGIGYSIEFKLKLQVAYCQIITKDIWSVHFGCTIENIIGYHLALTLLSLLLRYWYNFEVYARMFFTIVDGKALMPLRGETDTVIHPSWVFTVLKDNH
jgi:hypothetical protein